MASWGVVHCQMLVGSQNHIHGPQCEIMSGRIIDIIGIPMKQGDMNYIPKVYR